MCVCVWMTKENLAVTFTCDTYPYFISILLLLKWL